MARPPTAVAGVIGCNSSAEAPLVTRSGPRRVVIAARDGTAMATELWRARRSSSCCSSKTSEICSEAASAVAVLLPPRVAPLGRPADWRRFARQQSLAMQHGALRTSTAAAPKPSRARSRRATHRPARRQMTPDCSVGDMGGSGGNGDGALQPGARGGSGGGAVHPGCHGGGGGANGEAGGTHTAAWHTPEGTELQGVPSGRGVASEQPPVSSQRPAR